MGTATLTSLLEYLYGTLSISNMRWVGEHLIEHADKAESEQLRPYTMEEINSMVDVSERQLAEGKWQDGEEVIREIEEEFRTGKDKETFAEAI